MLISDPRSRISRFPGAAVIAAASLAHWLLFVLPAVAYCQEQPTRIEKFAPEPGAPLIADEATKISADVFLSALPSKSIDYFVELEINGKSAGIFKFQVTAGQISGTEHLTWYIRPSGRWVTLRLRLFTIIQDGTQYSFNDLSRDYSTVCDPDKFWLLRKLDDFFGCCDG